MTLQWRKVMVGAYNTEERDIANVADTEFGLLVWHNEFLPYFSPSFGPLTNGGYIAADMTLIPWIDRYNGKPFTVSCDTSDEAKSRCERYAKLLVLK